MNEMTRENKKPKVELRKNCKTYDIRTEKETKEKKYEEITTHHFHISKILYSLRKFQRVLTSR